MQNLDLKNDIEGKTKWSVNEILGDSKHKIPYDNGYFGSYSLIEYKGKQAIVFVDDSDAIVHVVTDFYDKILYGSKYNTWSGDYRYNNDKPVVVFDKNLGYNIVKKHSNTLLCKQWLPILSGEWIYKGKIGYCMTGVSSDFKNIFITQIGTILPSDEVDISKINEKINNLKTWDSKKILNDWILKDCPCYHIRGLEYKGAQEIRISKDDAIKLLRTHHRFEGMFNSAEWKVLDCQIALLFRDYANSDYD